MQALVYGAETGGAFSVLQSVAATTVVSPFATFAGAGLAAAGAWLGMNRDAPGVISKLMKIAQVVITWLWAL